MDGDPETLAPTAEGDASRQETRVLTPEEVARDFLRGGDGGVITQDARSQASRRRRRNVRAAAPTIVVVVGAGAVLAGLAAFTLLPNRPTSAPPPQAQSHQPAGAAVATTTSTPSSASASISTTAPLTLLPHAVVKVDVLNAYGSGRLATVTATALKRLGFNIGSVGNAPGDIASGQPSQILYGPSALADADTLAQSLSGPVIETSTSNLSGNLLELWVASPQLTVKTS